MEILKPSKKNLKFLGNELQNGKLVAFPTDTVYGLGAVVNCKRSVKRLYEIKNRPFESPIIILIGDKNDLKKIAKLNSNSEIVYKLIEKFWPGGLTLVLNKKETVSDILSAGGNTIGVRMPANDIACTLIKNSGGALAVPSANKTGQLSPTTALHVKSSFNEEEISYIIDGGTTQKGIESTILDMTKPTPLILRNGVVTKSEIEAIIGNVDELKNKKKSEKKFNKDIILVDKDEIINLNKDYVYLAFKKPETKLNFSKVEILSESGNYEEAVKNFFNCLHELNKTTSPVIYVEKIEEKEQGKLLMERINKITNKTQGS